MALSVDRVAETLPAMSSLAQRADRTDRAQKAPGHFNYHCLLRTTCKKAGRSCLIGESFA